MHACIGTTDKGTTDASQCSGLFGYRSLVRCLRALRVTQNGSSLKDVHSLNTTTYLLVCPVAVWEVVAQGLPVPCSLRDSKFRVAVSSSSVSTTRCRCASLLEPKESAPHPLETRGWRREREKKSAV